jgi:hypothetical protein
VPAGFGLAIGAFGAGILAPLLLVLGLAMSGLYGLVSRSALPRTDAVGCPVGHYVW